MSLHVCREQSKKELGVTQDRFPGVSKDKFCLTDPFAWADYTRSAGLRSTRQVPGCGK